MSSRSFLPATTARTRGFTLVEMVVTLSIFVLLSAAVFGIITGVLESSSSLQENQNRADEISALHAFLEKKLSGLPGQSIMTSYRRGDGAGLEQNGVVFGTVNFLMAIDATMQANGLYALRLARLDGGTSDPNNQIEFQKDLTDTDDKLNWTGLIHDVSHLEWRFQALNSTQWVTLWTDGSNKPTLVELSIQIAGNAQPTVMDFWIPPIVAPPALHISDPNTAPSS